MRRRRDEWARAGLLDQLHAAVTDADDQVVGLDLEHVCIDGCITKAPRWARTSPCTWTPGMPTPRAVSSCTSVVWAARSPREARRSRSGTGGWWRRRTRGRTTSGSCAAAPSGPNWQCRRTWTWRWRSSRRVPCYGWHGPGTAGRADQDHHASADQLADALRLHVPDHAHSTVGHRKSQSPAGHRSVAVSSTMRTLAQNCSHVDTALRSASRRRAARRDWPPRGRLGPPGTRGGWTRRHRSHTTAPPQCHCRTPRRAASRRRCCRSRRPSRATAAARPRGRPPGRPRETEAWCSPGDARWRAVG